MRYNIGLLAIFIFFSSIVYIPKKAPCNCAVKVRLYYKGKLMAKDVGKNWASSVEKNVYFEGKRILCDSVTYEAVKK